MRSLWATHALPFRAAANFLRRGQATGHFFCRRSLPTVISRRLFPSADHCTPRPRNRDARGHRRSERVSGTGSRSSVILGLPLVQRATRIHCRILADLKEYT